jgi:ribonuclease HI
LLFAESHWGGSGSTAHRGRWRFVLESLDGADRFEAADEEAGATPQRLDLLAVVRGLEALDQPSRVTLVTGSSYVSRGIRFGLAEWRENDWMWERFGKMTPVKDSDLWRRVDQALAIHQVECRTWRFETPTPCQAAPAPATPEPAAPLVQRPATVSPRSSRRRIRRMPGMTSLLDRGADAVRRALTAAAGTLASPLTSSGNLR